MKVVAVMPAYQEGTRIAAAIGEVASFIPDIVVVDDGSTDDTAWQAKSAGARVISHLINRGQGAALKTGTLAALDLGADIVVHIDADGQQDAAYLTALLAPLLNGEADVVFGSRFLGVAAEGMPWSRQQLLRAARSFSSYALGVPYRMTDPQSGLRAMTAAACRQIQFQQRGRAHCSEILRCVSRSGLRWQEAPVRVSYTSATLAKGNRASHAFEIVWHLFLGVFSHER